MFHRSISPPRTKSFFIFGARGTGKSTYIRHQWKQPHHYINLLLDRYERRYQDNPDILISDIQSLKKKPTWVVIDEIQKVPKLLDIVHELIETTKIRFVMTGSSPRKLKRSSSNLLAGRAFYEQMYPLTHLELKNEFDLQQVLQFGSLPSVIGLSERDKISYLNSYCQAYLREEILQEQLVRNGIAFRNFLEISGQENGKCINFTKIAKEVRVDTKTIQNYFQILEDTLLGYLLPAYTKSARQSVKLQPKFYLFDLGVKRSLEHRLLDPLEPRSYAYGDAFEHFVILECIRLNTYFKKDYQLYHYQTTSGGEVDLILQRGKEILAIEIKSNNQVDEKKVEKFIRAAEPLHPTQYYFVSQDPTRTKIGKAVCIHWKDWLSEIF